MPAGDLAQVTLVVAQHRRAQALAPPVGAHKTERLVQPLAAVLLSPPDPAEGDRLAIHLGKEHVPHRIAVCQVGEHPGDLVHSIDKVEAVGGVAGVEDGDHDRIIGLAAKAAKDQPGDGRRSGYVDERRFSMAPH